jgi:predicted ATPase
VNEALNNQERCWDAELHRLRGEFLLVKGDYKPEAAATAEAAFRRSMEIAQAQQALAFELRAATSLARLWHSQQRFLEAKHLLTSMLAKFSEGQTAPDNQSAYSLLALLK